MDPWLRDLAKVSRERQDEERNRLDERWDRLSSGDLSPEEEEELRALAETSDEAREAYEAFRPLGPEFHARVVGEIRKRGLVPEVEVRKKKPAKLWTFRDLVGPVARWGSLAAAVPAAAVLLVMALRPAPIPGYAAPSVSGVSSFRSEQSETTVPVLVPGRPCDVTLYPETTVSDAKDLQAQCFLSRGADLRSLEAQSEFDPSGSVNMTVMIDHDIRPGTWTFWVVIGRRSEMPDPDILRHLLTKAQVRQRDWVAVSREIQIQSRNLPP